MTAKTRSLAEKTQAQKKLLNDLFYRLPNSLLDEDDRLAHTQTARWKAAQERVLGLIAEPSPDTVPDRQDIFRSIEALNRLNELLKSYVAFRYRAPDVAAFQKAFRRVAKSAADWQQLLTLRIGANGETVATAEMWNFMGHVHGGSATQALGSRADVLAAISRENEFHAVAGNTELLKAMTLIFDVATDAATLLTKTKRDFAARDLGYGLANWWHRHMGQPPTIHGGNEGAPKTRFEHFCMDVIALLPDPDRFPIPEHVMSFAKQAKRDWLERQKQLEKSQALKV